MASLVLKMSVSLDRKIVVPGSLAEAGWGPATIARGDLAAGGAVAHLSLDALVITRSADSCRRLPLPNPKGC